MERTMKVSDDNTKQARNHGLWALRQAVKCARKELFATSEGWLEYADGVFSCLFLLLGDSRPASYYRVRDTIRNARLP